MTVDFSDLENSTVSLFSLGVTIESLPKDTDMAVSLGAIKLSPSSIGVKSSSIKVKGIEAGVYPLKAASVLINGSNDTAYFLFSSTLLSLGLEILKSWYTSQFSGVKVIIGFSNAASSGSMSVILACNSTFAFGLF